MLLSGPRYAWLPNNLDRGHQIAKAKIRCLRSLVLGGGVLPKSRRQRLTQTNLNYGQPDDGQTEHDGPDSEDAASEGVCFHGLTLTPAVPKVLIERNHSAID
jgi:hypothetical protein